ncbi:MAG TPA: hypothetical protein VIX90_16025 [Edaphobacter sp.]
MSISPNGDSVDGQYLSRLLQVRQAASGNWIAIVIIACFLYTSLFYKEQ